MNVLHMSISATILILAIVVIRALVLHKLPKKTFLVLWGLILFRLLTPFYVSLPLGSNTVTNMSIGLVEAVEVAVTTSTTIHSDMVQSVTPDTIQNTTPNFVHDIIPLPSRFIAHIAPASTVLVVWILGMIGLAVFFVTTHIRGMKKYMSSIPIENAYIREWLQTHKLRRSIQIRQSDRINAPMSYGIWKPTILLPKSTDWQNENQLRFILAHEFVHIKRFDVLAKWFLAATLCIHWFNPFIWVMYVLANRDLEFACDETVIQSLGDMSKSAYVLTLIGLEERKSGFSHLYNNFARNAIEERIVAIMKIKRKSFFAVMLAVLLVSVMTIGTLAANAQIINGNNPLPNDVVNFLQQRYEENVDLSSVTLYDNVAAPTATINFDELGLCPVYVVARRGCMEEWTTFMQRYQPKHCCQLAVYAGNPLPDDAYEFLSKLFGDSVDLAGVQIFEGQDIPANIMEHILQEHNLYNNAHRHYATSLDDEAVMPNLIFVERHVQIYVDSLTVEEFSELSEAERIELASAYAWDLSYFAQNLTSDVDYQDSNYQGIVPLCSCGWCWQFGQCRGINVFVSCHSMNTHTVVSVQQHFVTIIGGVMFYGPCLWQSVVTATCSRWGCSASGTSTGTFWANC